MIILFVFHVDFVSSFQKLLDMEDVMKLNKKFASGKMTQKVTFLPLAGLIKDSKN